MGRKLEDIVVDMVRKGKSRYQALVEIYRRVEKGEIRLIDPRPPRSFLAYLLRPAYALWFYTALTMLILAIVAILLSHKLPWIIPLRYLFGVIYVLFLPGYSLVEALYPAEGQISPLERLALSIGLSLAMVPLLGLVLNFTPWGIRLEPYIVLSSTCIASLLLTAAYRKYLLLKSKLPLASTGA